MAPMLRVSEDPAVDTDYCNALSLPIDECLYCGTPLDDDTNHPYCSAICAIDAEAEGAL